MRRLFLWITLSTGRDGPDTFHGPRVIHNIEAIDVGIAEIAPRVEVIAVIHMLKKQREQVAVRHEDGRAVYVVEWVDDAQNPVRRILTRLGARQTERGVGERMAEQFEPIVARFKREDAFAQLRLRLDGQLLGCGERCDRGSSSRIVARDDAVDGNVSKEVSEGECLLFAGFGEWGVRLLASRRAMTDEIERRHGVPP